MLDLDLHPIMQLHLFLPPVSSLSSSMSTILPDGAVSDLLTPYLLTSNLHVGKNTMIKIHRTKGIGSNVSQFLRVSTHMPAQFCLFIFSDMEPVHI